MKVIFLDVDGVLNHSGLMMQRSELLTSDELYKSMICPSCVALLQLLIKETDAKVVLSSTWRRFHELEKNQEYIGVELLDKTIYMSGEPRGKEIKEWLDNNKQVTHYVVIDDDMDIEPYVSNHVVTSGRTGGFNFEAFQKAKEILNG